MEIIGYIHICQRGQWQRSFKMLLDCIKNSKLYENTKVIRLGIVNDDGIIIYDDILKDDKFEIVYIGKSEEYERPTLLQMRKKSEEDSIHTLYYYLHTKGIGHFGNNNEQQIIDWINLMLYWNIEKWELAIDKLQTYDTYGCNDVGWHYSGNFWWARSTHIKKLPTKIEAYYTAPEDWVQLIRHNKFTVYNSGFQGMGHYTNIFPREKYADDSFDTKRLIIQKRVDERRRQILEEKQSIIPKLLVLYVFHIYNDRVKHFIENCIFKDENIDFIIISNDKNNRFDAPAYVKILFRDNIGYDFGGWSDALLTDNLYENYENFIFVNSSVIGPFVPSYYKGKWTDIYINGLQNNVKLFGSTINTRNDPLNQSHVQSYIFTMNKTTLQYLFHCEIFSITNYAKTFDEAIWNKEVLMSRHIIKNNWNIGSLFPYYKNVDFTFSCKKPEEYNMVFLGDIMFQHFKNTLWNVHELVFVKGNRVQHTRFDYVQDGHSFSHVSI